MQILCQYILLLIYINLYDYTLYIYNKNDKSVMIFKVSCLAYLCNWIMNLVGVVFPRETADCNITNHIITKPKIEFFWFLELKKKLIHGHHNLRVKSKLIE